MVCVRVLDLKNLDFRVLDQNWEYVLELILAYLINILAD